MGDEVTLSGVLVGALTASVGLIAKQVGEYFVKRRLEERDTAYQAAVDLLTTMPAVTHVFERTASCKPPDKYEDLIAYPNSWPIRPPSLDLKTLVSAFADAELHRELMLIGDRHAAYANCSSEHRKAFDWLLEHEGEDWKTHASARERLGTLNDQRKRLTDNAREILRNSHSALRRLVAIIRRWPTWPTDRYTALADLMNSRYRLPIDALERAAQYYANSATFARFDAQGKWTTVEWADDSNSKSLVLKLIGMGAEFPTRITLEPHVRIAVPVGVKITEAFIGNILVLLNYSGAVLKRQAGYELLAMTQ